MKAPFEIPEPPYSVAFRPLSELHQLNKPVGHFASHPARLACYLTLLADPQTPVSGQDVLQKLRDAAPSVALESETARRMTHIISQIFKPKARLGYATAKDGVKGQFNTYRASDEGMLAAPAVSLLAARWLLKPDKTRTVLAPARYSYFSHGTRVACLEAVNDGEPAKASDIAMLVEKPLEHTYGHLMGLIKDELMVRNTQRGKRATFITAQAVSSTVTEIGGQLHGLQIPAYAEQLGGPVLRHIVDTPELYGRLAEATLTDIMQLREVQAR